MIVPYHTIPYDTIPYHKKMIRRISTLQLKFFSKRFVHNIPSKKSPACANCVHWRLGENTCRLFFERDVIYGDEKYISARECRKDETKCGQEAILYKELSTAEGWQKALGYLMFKLILPVSILTTGTLMMCDYLFSSPPRRRSF